jgi:hemolysin activation/secretion protein
MASKGSYGVASVLAALASFAPSAALAQVSGIEGRSSVDPNPLPDLPEYRSEDNPFADSPLTLAPETPGRAATTQTFVAREIQVDGVTILPTPEIEAITQRYLNRPIGANDLLALRDEITMAYVEAGYLNSGAVVPDQDVSDGVVELDVIDGRLSGVEVRGLSHLNERYVTSRVRTGAVLDRADLEASFARLSSDPNIAQVNARLGPGARPGEAVLTLDVREADRWSGEAEVASDRSPSVGGERAILRSSFRNAFGWGDRWSLELGATEGLRDAALSFAAPLTSEDLTLTLEVNGSTAEVVEEPLNDLDIISDSFTFRASLTKPLYRSGGTVLTGGIGASYMHSQTELLGEPFSFSPGTVDGETALTVAHATLDLIRQSPRQVLALRSTLSYGLDAIDQVDGAPDALEPNFLYLTMQAQFARATTDSGQQFLARADVQLAQDSLFAMQQFSFGGADSVRGYRKNQVLSDNGAVASLEYRVPLRDLRFGNDARESGSPRWYGAVFVDAGYGWNTELPDPEIETLLSAGVSLTWRPSDRIAAQLYAAQQIEDVPEPSTEGVQDYGIGFRLTARLW